MTLSGKQELRGERKKEKRGGGDGEREVTEVTDTIYIGSTHVRQQVGGLGVVTEVKRVSIVTASKRTED